MSSIPFAGTTGGSYSRYRSSRYTINNTIHQFNETATVLDEVYDMLNSANIPGPAMIPDYGEYIGHGSQFKVQKSTLYWAQDDRMVGKIVAVKHPKFELDPNRPIDLVDGEAHQHLQSIMLEVKALTTPALSRHPNIVRLLSWCMIHTIHFPIGLVMELASKDLEQAISQHNDLPTWQRYLLCYDIASGLDAIHGCKLVHGDLKPSNILIFSRSTRLVAALADFGLSAEELQGGDLGTRLAGTPGWQAPEVEQGRRLTAGELYKADNYSFGLVIWHTMIGCRQGKPPLCPSTTTQESWIEEGIAQSRYISSRRALGCIVKPLLQVLLSVHPSGRPERVGPLFDFGWLGRGRETRFKRFIRPADGIEFPSTFKIPSLLHRKWKWPFEISTLSADSAPDLARQLMIDPENSRPDILFGLFLDGTTDRFTIPQVSSPVQLLLASARQGYPAAMAVVPAVLEYYGQDLPIDVQSFIKRWLHQGVVTGSTGARLRLADLDSDELSSALVTFRHVGGYNLTYLFNFPSNPLHMLCAHGTLLRLREYLQLTPNADLEARAAGGETPLYLACARGSWEIVSEMLDHGADASVICTSLQISCLHWLFSFVGSEQRAVAEGLIARGADINSLALQPIPFYHYPFVLPAGSPLHWAVVLASHQMIATLVDLGADLMVRDGSYPYLFDMRVRDMDVYGGAHLEAYSTPRSKPQGLSALDYATMDYDPFLFEYLKKSRRHVDVNNSDEEGFIALHRLTSSPVRRTLTENRFGFRPFLGSQTSIQDRVERTITAIKALGGGLDRLSTAQCYLGELCAKHVAMSNRNGCYASVTPLMLAVMDAATETVAAFLKAGANPMIENEKGNTALHYLSQRNTQTGDFKEGQCIEIARLLISHGALATHKNKLGNTGLLNAAKVRCFEAIDLLLSHGADIEEVDRSQDQAGLAAGLSFFSHLVPSHPGNSSTEGDHAKTDATISQLLTKHVLNCPDSAKRRRVMRASSMFSGKTILHSLVQAVLPQSVAVAIECGADVNQPLVKETRRVRGRKFLTVRWEDHALDVIEETNRRASKLAKDNIISLDRYNEYQQFRDEVTDILKQAGGVKAESCETVLREEDIPCR